MREPLNREPDVRFTPESRHVQRKRSCPLYPPKADMCSALGDVRFVPKADIPVVKRRFGGLRD